MSWDLITEETEGDDDVAFGDDETVDAPKVSRKKVTVKSSRVKLKLHNKQAALSDLARIHGMFKDNLSLTGKEGGPVAVQGDINLKTAADAYLTAIGRKG